MLKFFQANPPIQIERGEVNSATQTGVIRVSDITGPSDQLLSQT